MHVRIIRCGDADIEDGAPRSAPDVTLQPRSRRHPAVPMPAYKDYNQLSFQIRRSSLVVSFRFRFDSRWRSQKLYYIRIFRVSSAFCYELCYGMLDGPFRREIAHARVQARRVKLTFT